LASGVLVERQLRNCYCKATSGTRGNRAEVVRPLPLIWHGSSPTRSGMWRRRDRARHGRSRARGLEESRASRASCCLEARSRRDRDVSNIAATSPGFDNAQCFVLSRRVLSVRINPDVELIGHHRAVARSISCPSGASVAPELSTVRLRLEPTELAPCQLDS